MKFYCKMAIAIAGVALSFTATDAKPTQAAILTYDYTETPFKAGSYVNGTFSFDNSGGGTIFKVTNFTLDWNQSDGSNIALFPNPNPLGNAYPSSLPMWNSSTGSLVGEYQQCGRVCTDNFFENGQTKGNLFFNGTTVASTSGSVSYTEVPEPSGVAGLLVFGLGLLVKLR